MLNHLCPFLPGSKEFVVPQVVLTLLCNLAVCLWARILKKPSLKKLGNKVDLDRFAVDEYRRRKLVGDPGTFSQVNRTAYSPVPFLLFQRSIFFGVVIYCLVPRRRSLVVRGHALRCGIDISRFAWRFGTDVNGSLPNHQPSCSLFSRLDRSALGDET